MIRFMRYAFVVSAAALAMGCEDAVEQSTYVPPARTAPTATADAGPVFKGDDFAEADFVETDRSRDPFRSYLVADRIVKEEVKNQREVKLPQYTVEELKLSMVQLGGDMPRAMFIDPKGLGHILYRGDYVGKPEIVHTGGATGTDYQLNWRIDKIREREFDCPEGIYDPTSDGRQRPGVRRKCTRSEVELVREDVTNSQVPAARKTVYVHPELADKSG